MAAERGTLPAVTPVVDWPVAPIPDLEVHPTHTAGALLPLRWPHHGDLRIIVDDRGGKPGRTPEIHVAADDLHALAEIPDDQDPHPTISPRILWARHGADPIRCYSLTQALAVIEHTATHATGELLAWMREQIPLVIRDEVLAAATPLESFLDAYTVQQAAIILDGDPQITTGRTRLFTVLEGFGWIARDRAGHWQPLAAPLQHQLLTVRDITIRSGTRAAEAYRQLYITPTGLSELRRLMHALNPTVPVIDQPTLPIDV